MLCGEIEKRLRATFLQGRTKKKGPCLCDAEQNTATESDESIFFLNDQPLHNVIDTSIFSTICICIFDMMGQAQANLRDLTDSSECRDCPRDDTT